MNKRTWGKSKLYFCPINRKVWQLRGSSYKVYDDMPSYGLERKAIK